jgi:hypothetical protein
MRASLSLLIVVLILGGEAWVLVRSNALVFVSRADRLISSAQPSSRTAKPNFDSEIKPIFQARCRPCHFPGGKVYDKMPFDKPETITRLGTKLFTRIKDEKEQQKIREFLEQQ